MDLKIEYVPLVSLKEYKGNAKEHPPKQVAEIRESIQEFGMIDPIGIWGDNVIVEGHGRAMACRELGLDVVPVIRLDQLTDEQRRAYALVHNKTAMDSGFDFEILEGELEGIDGIDMSLYGFEAPEEVEEEPAPEEQESPVDALPESMVYICAVSVFGTKSESIIYRKLSQETADRVLAAVKNGGAAVADKLTEVLNAV